MTDNDHTALDRSAPLVTALAIAAGTACYATPVRFDNDGSFGWSDGIYLDITKGVRRQTGLDAGRASFQYELLPDSYYSFYAHKLVRGSTPDAQIKTTLGLVAVGERGDVVPDGFYAHGQTWERRTVLGGYYQGGFYFGTYFTKSYPANNIPGPPEYIAARFNLPDGTHYGWLGLSLTHLTGPTPPNWHFDLLAWGYETEPDTPLPAGAAPAPGGALAALALGAAAGMTRTRRELNTPTAP